jgi:imidazole glycerol phosphate synthase glutamine amidotransferase subunit
VKVTLLDYGAGNVTSVERALHKLGADTERATTPQSISAAQTLLLPGVGHYAALIRALDERSLRAPLLAAIRRGVPFLGICLGLQALYDASDEAPEFPGLQIFPGRVRALPASVKLPHMGWNRIHSTHDSRLLAGISSTAYFYFAHSYAATTESPGVVASCTHGTEFAAVAEQQNIFAVQFHPEKSAAAGAQVLQNFLGLAA